MLLLALLLLLLLLLLVVRVVVLPGWLLPDVTRAVERGVRAR